MNRNTFRRRTNIVFAIVGVGTFLVCVYYNLRFKPAAVLASFAGFVAAGIWLIVVEDILNPLKRDSKDEG